MSFNAYLLKYSKKINSTAQPSFNPFPSTAKAVLIDLKDNTNLLSPVITLADAIFSDQTFSNPVDFNYAYIPSFKRYYFIQDGWTWESGVWSCRLTVDVLASFKADIGSAYLYVLRSASEWDGSIIDTKYPAKPARTVRYYTVTNPWKTELSYSSLSQGFYCVGILNASSSAVGATSYYAFTGQGMRDFIRVLYASPSWLNVTDDSISTDLQKLLLNPTQYITSAFWIPLPYPIANPTSISSLPYGWWSVSGVTAYPCRPEILSFEATLMSVPISTNPYKYYDTQYYMDMQPWTSLSIECFPFGVLPVDTSLFHAYEAERVQANVVMDMVTGKGQLRIEMTKTVSGAQQKALLTSLSAQVGIPIPFAQLSVDWGGLSSTSTYVKTAGMLASNSSFGDKVKNFWSKITRPIEAQGTLADITKQAVQQADLGSTIKEIAADIGNALTMGLGSPEVTGSAGGFAGLYKPPVAIWQHSEQVAQDLQHFGRPLCAKRTINTLSGFILVQDGDDFTSNCTKAEREQIVAFLEGGFYYE